MSGGDIPTIRAKPLMAVPKTCPHAEWRSLSQGRIEKWELAVGAIASDPSLQGALAVQMHCMRVLRPASESYKFGLWYREGGAPHRVYHRVYMIEADYPPLGREGSHDWPHEHIGADDRRVFSKNDLPKSFNDVLTRFVDQCKITFEEPLSNPLHFELRP